MTTNIQKIKEKIIGEQLLHSLGKSWTISFPPNEEEWPDLIVNAGGETFGLEIREFTNDDELRKGSQRRAVESRNIQKLGQLADAYYEISSIPLNVQIIGNIDNKNILPELCKHAISTDEMVHSRLKLKDRTIIHVTRLPESLKQYKNWQYTDDRVGWVREINRYYLTPFILQKESKLDKYTKHLNDVRLLLTADPTFSSGMVSYEDSEFCIETSFNEIYLFLYPDQVFKLKNPLT